ncbi:hypothetical protein BDY19DRAFT_998943 [Irpex rosettiformis]|uniref:Uncharacterized protein n=1 Tax=Irpex rosettiformis TaxID=378272 RepID=A0ACB8TLX7_9APHY|nr:hypothetical protein BDY19DRAFT_998943 [Irpex rosettiformis]
MEGHGNLPRQHAARSKAAREAAKQREALVDLKLCELREYTDNYLEKVAEESGKPTEWLETRFYQMGKLSKQQRGVNSYNAYISRLAKEHREKGLPSQGKDTMIMLAKEAAESGAWKTAPVEVMESMKDDIEKQRQSRGTKKVTEKMIGRDIDSTMTRIEIEADGLHKRTRAEYLVLTLHSDVTDTWPMRVRASQRVDDAIFQLYKQTLDVFALKVQAYLTTGIAGVLKAGTKQPGAVALRSTIRNDVTGTLHAILINERNVPLGGLPDMGWAPSRYKKLVVDYGVELTGWTEPNGVCNLADLKTMPQLQRLKNAIDHGHCVWEALSDEDWEARRQSYNQYLETRNIKRKGKGKGKGAGKGKDAMDVDEDEGDDEDEDENGDDGDNGERDNDNLDAPGSGYHLIHPPIVPPVPVLQFVQGSSTGYAGYM